MFGWGVPVFPRYPYSVEPNSYLKFPHQAADAIWAMVIAACDAYFLRHEQAFLGDSRAPEWPDDQVQAQVERWDGYRRDSGAVNYDAAGYNNKDRPYAHDFTALPASWQRAICERAWGICKDAGLWEPDHPYMIALAERRAWRKERDAFDALKCSCLSEKGHAFMCSCCWPADHASVCPEKHGC